MPGRPPAERLIAYLPLFRQVARDPLAQLARQATFVDLRRGDVLCRRGQLLESLYGVVQGQVKLVLRASNGEERVLRIVGQGDTFAEAMVLRPRPAPFDAIALCDTSAVELPARAVNALLERDAPFARAMFLRLAERTHELVAEIESSTLLSARQRIASYLIGLARTGTRVHLPVTKTLIASQLGVTKETLSRLLREFSDQSLIQVHNRNVLVRDRARLSGIAQPGLDRVSDKRASGSSSR